MLGGGLENVEQGRDEGVDAAAQVLQVDQDHVKAVDHCRGRAAHLAIEAEHRDAVHRIGEIRAFNHIVLLVAAQPVLRPEGGGQLDVVERGQGIERMHQISGHRGRMREQRDATALERRAQLGLSQKTIDTEEHGGLAAR